MGQNSSKRRQRASGKSKAGNTDTVSPGKSEDINGSIEVSQDKDGGIATSGRNSYPASPTSVTSASPPKTPEKKEKRKRFRVGFSLKRTPSGRWSRKKKTTTQNGVRPVSCTDSIRGDDDLNPGRPQSLFLEEVQIEEEENKIETVDLSDDEEGKAGSSDGNKNVPKVPERTKWGRGSNKKSSGKKKKKETPKKDKKKKQKNAETLTTATKLSEAGRVSEAPSEVGMTSAKPTEKHQEPVKASDSTENKTVRDSELSEIDINKIASDIVFQSVKIAQERLRSESCNGTSSIPLRDDEPEMKDTEINTLQGEEVASEGLEVACENYRLDVEDIHLEVENGYSEVVGNSLSSQIETKDSAVKIAQDIIAEIMDKSVVIGDIKTENTDYQTDCQAHENGVDYTENADVTTAEVQEISEEGGMEVNYYNPDQEKHEDKGSMKIKSYIIQENLASADDTGFENLDKKGDKNIEEYVSEMVARKTVQNVIAAALQVVRNDEFNKDNKYNVNSHIEDGCTDIVLQPNNNTDEFRNEEDNKAIVEPNEQNTVLEVVNEEKSKEVEGKIHEKTEKIKSKSDIKMKVQKKLSHWFHKKDKQQKSDCKSEHPTSTKESTVSGETSECSRYNQDPSQKEMLESPSDSHGCISPNTANTSLVLDVSQEPLAVSTSFPSVSSPASNKATIPSESTSPTSIISDTNEVESPSAAGDNKQDSGSLKKISIGSRLQTAIFRKRSSEGSDNGPETEKQFPSPPEPVDSNVLTPPPRKSRNKKSDQTSPGAPDVLASVDITQSIHKETDSVMNIIPQSPYEVTDSVVNITSQSHEVTDSVMDIIPQYPHEITDSVVDISPQSHEVTDSVVDISPQSHEVTDSVVDILPQSHEVTDSVVDVSPQSLEVTDLVMDIAPQYPHEITDSVINIFPQSHEVTDSVVDITPQSPHGATYPAMDTTPQSPHDITDAVIVCNSETQNSSVIDKERGCADLTSLESNTSDSCLPETTAALFSSPLKETKCDDSAQENLKTTLDVLNSAQDISPQTADVFNSARSISQEGGIADDSVHHTSQETLGAPNSVYDSSQETVTFLDSVHQISQEKVTVNGFAHHISKETVTGNGFVHHISQEIVTVNGSAHDNSQEAVIVNDSVHHILQKTETVIDSAHDNSQKTVDVIYSVNINSCGKDNEALMDSATCTFKETTSVPDYEPVSSEDTVADLFSNLETSEETATALHSNLKASEETSAALDSEPTTKEEPKVVFYSTHDPSVEQLTVFDSGSTISKDTTDVYFKHEPLEETVVLKSTHWNSNQTASIMDSGNLISDEVTPDFESTSVTSFKPFTNHQNNIQENSHNDNNSENQNDYDDDTRPLSTDYTGAIVCSETVDYFSPLHSPKVISTAVIILRSPSNVEPSETVRLSTVQVQSKSRTQPANEHSLPAFELASGQSGSLISSQDSSSCELHELNASSVPLASSEGYSEDDQGQTKVDDEKTNLHEIFRNGNPEAQLNSVDDQIEELVKDCAFFESETFIQKDESFVRTIAEYKIGMPSEYQSLIHERFITEFPVDELTGQEAPANLTEDNEYQTQA